MNNVILAIIISGFFLIIFGLTLKKYPKAGWYLKLKNKDFISNLYESKFIGKILDFFTKNKNGFINRASKWVIDYTETDITLNKLCFYKVISVILVFLCLMSIKQTNLAVMKESIIAKPAQRFVLDLTAETKDFQYNMNFLFGNIFPRTESGLLLQISIAYMPLSRCRLMSRLPCRIRWISIVSSSTT